MITQPGLTLRGRKGNWPILTCIEGQEGTQRSIVEVLVEPDANPVRLERLLLIRAGGTSDLSCIAIGTGEVQLRTVFAYLPHCGATYPVGGEIWNTGVDLSGNAKLVCDECVFLTPLWLGGHSALTDCVMLAKPEPVFGTCVSVSISAQSHFRRCVIGARIGSRQATKVILDGITAGVFGAEQNTKDNSHILVGHSNVFGREPFTGILKPGKGCFSATPQFRDPKNLDFRLVPGSPGTGRASDGGDVGARYTPEMIEMIKAALELRAQGIINF